MVLGDMPSMKWQVFCNLGKVKVKSEGEKQLYIILAKFNNCNGSMRYVEKEIILIKALTDGQPGNIMSHRRT